MPQLQDYIDSIKRGDFARKPGSRPVRILFLRNMGLNDDDLVAISKALRNNNTAIVGIDVSNDPKQSNPNKFSHAKINVAGLLILHLSHTGVISIEIEGAPSLDVLTASHCNISRVRLIRSRVPSHLSLINNGIEILNNAIATGTISLEVLKLYIHQALVAYKTTVWPQALTESSQVYIAVLRGKYENNQKMQREMPVLMSLPDHVILAIVTRQSNLSVSLQNALQPIVKQLKAKLQSYATATAIDLAAETIKNELCKKAARAININPTVDRKRAIIYSTFTKDPHIPRGPGEDRDVFLRRSANSL